MINHRCSICDKTDNEDLIDESHEFTSGPFLPDPKNELFFICLGCFEEIRDTLEDFEDKEDEDDPFQFE